MKLKNLLTTFALVFISLLISGCSSKDLEVEDINYIIITSNDHVSEINTNYKIEKSHNDEIELFITTLNESLKSEEISNAAFNYDYLLEINYNNNIGKYYIDFEEDNSVIKKGNKYYKIPEEHISKLLKTRYFKELFHTNLPPVIQFSNKKSKIPTSFQGKWHYETYNNDYMELPILFDTEKQEPIIINSNNDLMTYSTKDKEADIVNIKVMSNNKVVYEGKQEDNTLFMPQFDGLYSYEVTFTWNSKEKPYYGNLSYIFDVEVDYPSSFEISTKDVYLGDIAILSAKNVNEDENISIKTDLIDNQINLLQYDKYLIGFIPIDTLKKPNKYNIEILSNDIITDNIEINVLDKQFPKQYLSVSSSTNSLRTDENYESDAKYIDEARSSSDKDKLWEGHFIQPVEGIITTRYSAIRYVNDSTEPYVHSGIDIAAPTGTPLLADNNGKIVLAMELIISGNTVIIDHGMGIFSSYLHLNSMDVEKGQIVKKGEKIGTVGSTGFSTGPHLHWTIHNNGVNVNPQFFIDKDPLDFIKNLE